ncbi:PspC domain-containing protein [Rhizosphaericola mali]|uniref:PspC domain-containing protein n=1 Tax=Rhizosphaericola mali TaxID=2545455 RepID=A0A5P2FX63_9BACT|nr:PspC domain-containing protein [Rhizosphaericola mali]QES87775.1 PspC domain-containing protein [Rhizosphaericola mali]
MKKVININFQGSLIPMEESAFAILTQYIDSLKIHFAKEEGKDEIIGDIENRIAELFGERMKKGAACITDDDVNAIIDSMGRPEDFDLDVEDVPTSNAEEKTTQTEQAETSNEESQQQKSTSEEGPKRFFRDENNKKLGGVCAGVANYFNIDPVVIRILAIVFSSVCFVPYIIMWIVIPSTATEHIGSTRKRLFRNSEDKKIAGVASGLAAYFGIKTKIVRILFLVPLISLVLNNHNWNFEWFGFPHFLSLSFVPSMVMIYIILWIVIPEATTTSEKLMMRGEPVDLNSIKDTIQKDLESSKWGKSINKSFNSAFSKKEKKSTSQGFTSTEETTSTENANNNNTTKKGGVGDTIALLFKIFAYCVIGIVLFAVIAALFGLGIGLLAFLPAKTYFLNSGWESIFSWGTFIFFIWVPFIAIITWIVRLITKRKENSAAYRTTFICFWGLGWICLFALISFVGRDFSNSFKTPENNYTYDKKIATLYIDRIKNNNEDYYNLDFTSMRDYLEYFGKDSINIQNIYVSYEPSFDSLYHVTYYKYANGKDEDDAKKHAYKINYALVTRDSTLNIPNSFAVSRTDKFRNQKVIVKVSIPVGKRIFIKNNLSFQNYMNFSFGEDGVYGVHSERGQDLKSGTLYIMTENGLQSLNYEDNPQDANTSGKDTSSHSQKGKVYEYHPKSKNTNNDEEDNTDDRQTSISTDDHSFSKLGFASLFLNKLAI